MVGETEPRAVVKDQVAAALDTVTAALLGVEFLGESRRRELALMLTRVRIAVEESL